MNCLTIQDILEATHGEAIGLDPTDLRGVRIHHDSRKVERGSLFWALKGPHFDGHQFIPEAFDKQASVCVTAQRENLAQGPTIRVEDTQQALWDLAKWHRQRQATMVIGITGSVGKTTTREMVYCVLSQNRPGMRSPENYNNDIGLPLSLLEIQHDHTFAILELAASACGEIEKLTELCSPSIGVVTGIGPAHLEGFGSFENILEAKSELLASLPDEGLAIVSGDDPHCRSLAAFSPCTVIRVGEEDHNNLQATDIQIDNRQIQFRCDKSSFLVPACGRHLIPAALTAIAIGRELGMIDDEIRQGLLSYRPMKGRCQTSIVGNWTVIDDSYNANPSSVEAACQLLHDWKTNSRKILVLGDMLELGEHAADYHQDLGSVIANCDIDEVLYLGQFGENLKTEAVSSRMLAERISVFDEIEPLEEALNTKLEPGAVILVKGSRGMKMERVVQWLENQSLSNHKEIPTSPPKGNYETN